MASKKKNPKKILPSSSTDTHRVNMTFTLEEYAQLEEEAGKVTPLPLPPTVMAKLLVMRALADRRTNPQPEGE
jgi:serine/threonine-protein kinase RIO1